MARLEVDVCGYCGLISGVMRVGDLWQGRWYCSDECKHAAEVAAVMAQSDDMRLQLEDAHVQLRDALTQREEMRLHREDMHLQLQQERLLRVEDRQQLYDTRLQLEDARMQLEDARRQLRDTLQLLGEQALLVDRRVREEAQDEAREAQLYLERMRSRRST